MLAAGFRALKRLESSMLEIIPSSNMVAVVVEEVVTYGSAFILPPSFTMECAWLSITLAAHRGLCCCSYAEYPGRK